MAYPYYSYGVFNFQSVLQQWAGIGLFDIILPIILIFTLVYAVLQRTGLLGKKKEIDAVVALVIGFFAISNPTVTQFFIPIFSNAALGLVIILVFLLITHLVNPRFKEEGWTGITLIGGFVIFIWVMSRAADYFGGSYLIFSADFWYGNAWWIVPLALFILLIAYVVKGDENSSTSTPDALKHPQLLWLPTEDETNKLKKS